MKYRKRPGEVEATQWFRNGDHPEDYTKSVTGPNEQKEFGWEGQVVRYFRRPDVSGGSICSHCGKEYNVHGWIDTLEGGHIVCPGDYIITGTHGEYYPCKPDIFSEIYEQVNDAADAAANAYDAARGAQRKRNCERIKKV